MTISVGITRDPNATSAVCARRFVGGIRFCHPARARTKPLAGFIRLSHHEVTRQALQSQTQARPARAGVCRMRDAGRRAQGLVQHPPHAAGIRSKSGRAELIFGIARVAGGSILSRHHAIDVRPGFDLPAPLPAPRAACRRSDVALRRDRSAAPRGACDGGGRRLDRLPVEHHADRRSPVGLDQPDDQRGRIHPLRQRSVPRLPRRGVRAGHGDALVHRGHHPEHDDCRHRRRRRQRGRR
jgi:hypothetical protein